MKKLTEYLITVLCVIALVLAGCAKEDDDGDKGKETNTALEQNWMLQEMVEDGEKISVIAGGPNITIQIKDNKVSGSGGCNSYSGTYVAEGEKSFSTTGIVSTEMACANSDYMNLEAMFFRILNKISSFDVSENSLELFTLDNQSILKFVLQEVSVPTSLVDVEWKLENFETREGETVSASALVPNSSIYVQFSSDNKASGSGGCNNYSGFYEKKDDVSITLRGLQITEMACAGDGVMEQESKYMSLLSNVARFEIKQNSLQLMDSEQKNVLNFVATE